MSRTRAAWAGPSDWPASPAKGRFKPAIPQAQPLAVHKVLSGTGGIIGGAALAAYFRRRIIGRTEGGKQVLRRGIPVRPT